MLNNFCLSECNLVLCGLCYFVSSWVEGCVMAQDVKGCCDCLKCVLNFGLKPFATSIQVSTRICVF